MIKSFVDNGEDQEITINVPANKPFINTFRSSKSSYKGRTYYYKTTEFIPEESAKYYILLEGYMYIKPKIMIDSEGVLTHAPTVRRPQKACTF